MHLLAAVVPPLFGEDVTWNPCMVLASSKLRVAKRYRADAEQPHRDAARHVNGDGERPHHPPGHKLGDDFGGKGGERGQPAQEAGDDQQSLNLT